MFGARETLWCNHHRLAPRAIKLESLQARRQGSTLSVLPTPDAVSGSMALPPLPDVRCLRPLPTAAYALHPLAGKSGKLDP